MSSFSKCFHAPPRPSTMIESLRGLGYSTATALADIIDNSITAQSSNIEIIFLWKGKDSTISIIDNGTGMNIEELQSAMRLGSKSPLEKREKNDLGRFGLGLKTASFSQCRRLTVSSKKEPDSDYTLCWDLDSLEINKDDGWYLIEGPAKGSEQYLLPLKYLKHGTVVLWENLDEILTIGFTDQNFLDLIDRIERHLSMVFHRYIEGFVPDLVISINGKPLTGWDPFLSKNIYTWSSPTESILTDYGKIEAQGFVLPHKEKLDVKAYEKAAGPDGWNSQQGFYVYRNRRLLVAGSWLGLGRGRAWTKEELYKLARIKLDIPNSADKEWKIDVRKSIARPPLNIREKLIYIAEDTRERARRVFAHRGVAFSNQNSDFPVQVWEVEHLTNGIHYTLNKLHPAIKASFEGNETGKPLLQAMLRIIEETLPVQQIWLDTADTHETPKASFLNSNSSEIMSILMVLFKNMVNNKGYSENNAKLLLLHTEPFDQYPELVSSLLNIS